MQIPFRQKCHNPPKLEMEVPFRAFSLLFSILLVLKDSNFIEAKHAKNTVIGANYGIKTLNRSSFPEGFIFGSATSAYQVLKLIPIAGCF